MAGHGHAYVKHGAVAVPHTDPRLKWGAKLLSATMWFYIFYRVKQDGPVMFGQKLPFEHHH
ncbi:hypothetical protein CANTEDRAFT_109089 [Yamadazyma tenuis ATCC 10573]|uniref:Uncharacterized protein n=1 Tax=Candida tenuis (strain ATCC 10573 / BCRC 21748 / CBS 615 / JCM 9827 / NBRC 10315 / NRRL Y-1498 / VKM Y-70) TaxID=590646 RepID=G3B7U1_CANTC|nr:uncharacterized protein CANTEDRAFT_109089 [Yamadazyma tenuis ATCC 10573]EGV62322.1 hypothetical protein CANTEDRAFT_109089 [Yamadazyma tenuis ATCC 10573]